MKLSVSQAHGWIYSQFVSSVTRKKWRVETVALLFSQEICIATSPRRLFCTFGQCVLLAIFLAVRSRSVRRVGSWKMTSWLLCVILLMRMSSRSRRVHRHCGASRPRALQIERLLTVPWKRCYRDLSRNYCIYRIDVFCYNTVLYLRSVWAVLTVIYRILGRYETITLSGTPLYRIRVKQAFHWTRAIKTNSTSFCNIL